MTREALKDKEFICSWCHDPFIGYQYFGHRTHCPKRPRGRGLTKVSRQKMRSHLKQIKVKTKDGRRKIKDGRRKRTTQAGGMTLAIKSIKGKIRFLTAKGANLRRQAQAIERQTASLNKALRYLS